MIIEDPRPDREEASPLLLVHGFLGEPADWDAVVAALRVPRRIVRANLLQHGAASGDLASLAAALAFAIGRSGLPPVSLVGYSLGGRVTMTLASAYPRLVRRAIAVSATPGIRDRDERTSRAVADDTLASALARDGISSFLDRWYAQPLFDSLRSHPDFALIARRRGDGDARAWATILRDASPGANPSLWEALGSLSSSLSLAVGSLDAKYLGVAREAARTAPALRIDVIEGAGHAVHLERPQALAALIDQTLA